MKLKIIITLGLMMFLNQVLYAQLKVTPSGFVGLGTNDPIYRLQVNGTILMTGNGNDFRITPQNPGTEIGTSTDRIDFWYSNTGHNKLYAEDFCTTSDSNLKVNIVKIKNPYEKLKLLTGYSYNMKEDKSLRPKLKYGFLAQEVERILPEVVDSSKGVKLINYNAIIPFLTEAIKEHQRVIDSLTHQLEKMDSQIVECCNKNQSLSNSIHNNSLNSTNVKNNSNIYINKLFQNVPNPFSEQTIIEYDIQENTNNASILVFDMQGTLKKTFHIYQNGNGKIIINGNELIAGMYLYSLIVNNKEIDTKKMILLE